MTCIVLFLVLLLPKCVLLVPTEETPHNTHHEEVNTLKHLTTILSDNLEKWNNLFLNMLEPRMASTATSLANIDSNINNLQERAHVWDTFQLHVSAWNDQLATLDRKADIISKGQEKILALDSKINTIANMEYKLDEALTKIDSVQEGLSNLKEETQNQRDHKNHDILFGEFATRGILSTIKMVEKKLDRLLLSQENSILRGKMGDERPKLTIKCNTPRFVEELLNDISSKVDVIFDRISGKDENVNDYGIDEYVDGSGDSEASLGSNDKKRRKRAIRTHQTINQPIEELLDKTTKIENISREILDKTNENFDRLSKKCRLHDIEGKMEILVDKYFARRETYLGNFPCGVEGRTRCGGGKIKRAVLIKSGKLGCEDLDRDHNSGIYIFGNPTEFNVMNRTFNEQYCEIRDESSWTVIQRRDAFTSPQSFNLSWSDYKNGFGDLNKDFWFGNDFISRLSQEKNLMLRFEVDNVWGGHYWGEYSTFRVLSEENNYQIIVDGLRGNASNLYPFSNGSLFSTFDKRNHHIRRTEDCTQKVRDDEGWWYSRCGEWHFNRLFRKIILSRGGYDIGIYMEGYHLRKVVMMVKPAKNLLATFNPRFD